jgi:hypothetical protein
MTRGFPPYRARSNMVVDETTGKTYLFGGYVGRVGSFSQTYSSPVVQGTYTQIFSCPHFSSLVLSKYTNAAFVRSLPIARPLAPLKITIRSRPTSTFLLKPLTTYGSSCLIRPADISTTPIFARTEMRREWTRGSAASRKFSNYRALSRNADVTPLDAVQSGASGRSVEGRAEARSSSARRTASSRAGRSIKRRTNVERCRPLSVGSEIHRKPHLNSAVSLYTANRVQPRMNAKCQRGTSINASAILLTKPALSGRCAGATAPQHSRLASESQQWPYASVYLLRLPVLVAQAHSLMILYIKPILSLTLEHL